MWRTPADARRLAVGRAFCLLAGAALAVTACENSPTSPDCPQISLQLSLTAPLAPVSSLNSPFDADFQAAAAEFGVPQSLLKGIGWIQTRWQMVEGTEEFPGRPALYGVMALGGEALERGAALAGVTVEAARGDPQANIRAAAALLARYAADAGVDPAQPQDWAPAVARFSGIDLAEAQAAYLQRVNAALEPEHRMSASGIAASIAQLPCEVGPGPDYPSALWRPSPNFNQRPADSTGMPHMVIIHTCEGEYTGCWSWLVNRASEASAHYVVDEGGTEISELVRERNRAWHIAALYDCGRDHGHDCWLNGVQGNDFTVGVEHAGFASQDSFPSAQLEASAALVCGLTRRLGVPRDWQHIVGHGQLQPENRTDPGPHWPWVRYLHLIQARCGEIVVDDALAYNDTAQAGADVPAAWPASDSTPDYYAAGYHWAPTAPDAGDAATFSFRLNAAATHTVDARWTSGTNRSQHAAYAVITAAGDTLATVMLDQTANGGRWQTLGTWSFPAGWNQVVLLRRDASGSVVVADAVRIR